MKMRMRNILDRLYVSSIWLAAIMMIGVLVMVLTSIISRLLHFHVPGTDAYAGYAMAGAGFLALAHTLKCNEHIRVTLIISKLHSTPRRVMELWSLSVAVLLSGLLTFMLGDWSFSRANFRIFQPPAMPHRFGFHRY